ncbi:MAG TPA: tripartite tricarboxylate transporter substrate-binding protein [Vicinamibacterales bacterium]|nr:tripartite tricarboxylate transporter substrate-binding protein [Vicinamibacterales bacterium]
MTLRASAVLILGTALALSFSPAHAQSLDQLRLIAPAAPGGGWDQTARVMQQALQREHIARLAPVENIPGAAGMIGLARFIGAERGRGDVLLVSGLIMLGGIVTHQSPVTLRDVVPIARLTGEYEVIAVPAASPLRSLHDLITAFKAQPGSISWGGGSAGGSDQILAGLVADAVGVDPKRVNYIAFSGGGESLSAILGGTVSVGINGFAEFAPQLEAGTLRALAISSAERLSGVDIPTLREQGVSVEFENWRSLVAAPGVTPADRARLESVVRAMVQSPTWRESLARYRWLDRYLDGDAFARFVDTEEARVRSILKKLGTGATTTISIVPSGAYPRLVLAGLGLFGLAALRRAWRRSATPPADASSAGATPLALVGTGVVLHLILAERAGFVIAATVLFWCTARAFDNRHPVRDAVAALALSLASYMLFARVLQLSLP